MAIAQAMCTSFKAEILDEQHDLIADTIKIALFTSSASLGAGTTAYSTTNEISGTGYTAAGAALTNTAVSVAQNIAFVDFSDLTFQTATITASAALIYNTSQANKAVVVLDFGGDKASTNGDFTIQFPNANSTSAILRIS